MLERRKDHADCSSLTQFRKEELRQRKATEVIHGEGHLDVRAARLCHSSWHSHAHYSSVENERVERREVFLQGKTSESFSESLDGGEGGEIKW